VDCKDEILLNLLAPKIQYISVVQLFAKRWKTSKENGKNRMQTAEDTVKLTYFSSKWRPQQDFHQHAALLES